MAGHVWDGTHRDAGLVHVNKEEADPFLFLDLRIGPREHEDVGRIVRHRRPDLLTVNDELIPLDHGPCLEACEVRSGPRLRITLAPDMVARQDRGQVAPPLLLRPPLDQHRSDHLDAMILEARNPPALNLFMEDERLAPGKPHTAVFDRPEGGDPAFGRHPQEPFRYHLEGWPMRQKAQFLRIVALEHGANDLPEFFIRQCIPVLFLANAVGNSHQAISWLRCFSSP